MDGQMWPTCLLSVLSALSEVYKDDDDDDDDDDNNNNNNNNL